MDLYVLDSLLRRSDVVDKYESLIWTERWQELGEFELQLKSDLGNRSFFTVGTRLACNGSHRVMTVETVEDAVKDDGKEVLLVKGRSLEHILEDRVAKETMSDLTVEPVWSITDTPGNVIREMFDHICRPPAALDPSDAIPFITAGSIFPADTIPEPLTPILWEQEPDALYTPIEKIAKLYDLGFRLVRNFDASQLYFDVYTGHDRTTRQTIFPPVVFSTNLDNLKDATEFTTIQKSKNVAYVYSEAGFAVVYGENVDPDVEGFERRILTVKADVGLDHPDIAGGLIQAGNEALMEHRAASLYDGEINEYNEYKYGVDYGLGDIVELRNKDGIITYKRVTEQIFVCDAQGERSYPTLSMDLFTGVNTWLAWNNKSTVWEDFTVEFWEDM